MTDDEVQTTMRRAARHYQEAAAAAPDELNSDVLQVALNYQTLADAMAAGEGAFQVLLTPPTSVDVTATEVVAAYLVENCG